MTWEGEGSLRVAVDAVIDACEASEMTCISQRSPESGVVDIEALQAAPPVRTVLRLLPQRVDWHVEADGKHLAVTADFQVFGWYPVLVGAMFTLGLLVPVLCLWVVNQPWSAALPGLRPVLGVLAAVMPLMVVAVPMLLGALGGGRVSMALWRRVVDRVETAGGYLEPVGSGVSRRYSRAMTWMTLSLLLFMSPFLWVGLRSIGDFLPGARLFYLLLLTLGGLAMGVAWVLLHRPGVGLRAEPVMLGVVSSATVVFSMLPVVVLGLAGFDAATLEGISLIDGRAMWGWSLVLFFVLMISVGLFVTTAGLRLAIPSWVVLERLHRHRGRGIFRQAVGGGPLLRTVRRGFVAVWLLSAVFLVAGLALVAWMALGTLLHFSAPAGVLPATHFPDLVAAAGAFILGLPWEQPGLVLLARTTFLLYSLGLWIFFGLSIGQLSSHRRSHRRELRERALTVDHPRKSELATIVSDLARRVALPPVQTVIEKGPTLWASSLDFGGWPRERFVVVSTGALQHLPHDQLQALVAHELAHQLRNHARAYHRLQWLGRFTFVGDGFVMALMDSFGFEVEADRVAVEELGVEPQALLNCLWQIRNAKQVAEHRRRVGVGLPIAAEWLTEAGEWRKDLSRQLDELSPGRRWRVAWKLFWQQYARPMALHYWHPATEERIAALQNRIHGESDA